ncbi:MAG: type VI secretion system baseplate subunit TssE [Proteobacteria bacterium]|nr:type VI secretion system baseplate subunit TssE [Pseudomonadota bacterium]
MPASRTLLQRLEAPGPPDQRELNADLRQLRDSIREHLQTLLNSVYGGSESAPEFGVPSFGDFIRGGQSGQAIESAVRRAIERYEPRLKEVNVAFDEGGEQGSAFELRFSITASVVTGHGQVPTVFRSIVEPTGHVRVGGG